MLIQILSTNQLNTSHIVEIDLSENKKHIPTDQQGCSKQPFS